MDESTPANESNQQGLNKIDLSQLQAFTFGTQWTEIKSVPPSQRRGDDRGERRDRRDDGGRGAPPRDRRVFRKPADAPGSAPGGAPAGAGAGEQRPPQQGERRDFGRGGEGFRGEGYRGGQRRDFHGGERRDFGRGEGDGPMERGPYISPYFTITCYPEDAGFSAMVKAIRASCRTFQLFEITKAVLEKNERFVAVIQRTVPEGARPAPAAPSAEGAAPAEAVRAPVKLAPLYMSVPDHLPFDTEEAAISHVLKNHLGQFFELQDVEIEAPKGNFPIINKCSITGELLGPPNHHRYQQTIQQHHATKLSRMSFDRFRESIVSVREPEVIQQWLDKMKKATRYTWKPIVPKPAAPAPASAEVTEPQPAPVEAPEVVSATPTDTPAPESTDTPVSAPETVVAEAAAPAAAPAGPSFDSLEEARAYLLTTAKEKVVRAFENVRFHGKSIELLPPGEIKRAVEGHVERQRRFPLDTANALRGRLRREGFTIFKKGSRGVSFVCAVKRRFRVPGQVFSESITHLISFIEKNPMVHVKELPAKCLGIDLAALLAAVPLPEGAVAPSQSPFAALPAEQAEKLRKMNNDLRWLVTEGYVTEFSDGKLYAPPPVTPQAGKRPDEHAEEHDPVDFPDAPAAAPAAKAPAAVPASEGTPVTVPSAAEAPAVAEAPVSAHAAEVSAAVEPAPEAPAPEATAPAVEDPAAPVAAAPSSSPVPTTERTPAAAEAPAPSAPPAPAGEPKPEGQA